MRVAIGLVAVAGFALATALAGAASLAVASPEKGKPTWEPIGLSGGGAMFSPAISPVDPKLILVNCDMSAAYVTRDGGSSWHMIHHAELQTSTRCRPAWHPKEAGTVVAAHGDSGLRVSRDKGEHWTALGKLPGAPRGEVAIDPGRPDLVLVGTDDGVLRSLDGGASWAKVAGPSGEGLAFHFDQTSPVARRTILAATRTGIWRSDDAGDSWARKTGGLPDAAIKAFAGGSNAKAKVCVLYCAVPCSVEGGTLAGGLYRSQNRGDSWERVMNEGLNLDTKKFDEWGMGPVVQYVHVLASDARPTTVYAFNASTGVPPPHHATCFRSDDAGGKWQATFNPDPRYPGCNVERDYTVAVDRQYYQNVPNGVAGCATNPDVALFVDDGKCYLTSDGGKSWRAGHTRPAPGSSPDDKPSRWACNGLVVTTTWNYYVDPCDPNRHFIGYTDIGFALSKDKGKSWEWWPQAGRAPWRNTCYELAFDPQVPGKAWGAFSDNHDIPNGNVISGRHGSALPGGVALTLDACESWKKSNSGLPNLPVVSVALDPTSKPGARTLYAAVFGAGVFGSTDDGATWTPRGAVGSAEDRRAIKVVVHADGTLFCVVTALKKDGHFVASGPGVWRSKDQGASWEDVTRSSPLLWPKDLTVDPKDSRVLYVGAADAEGKQQGGLWRTADGGERWERILRQGPEHFGAYLHPKRKGWIYATLTEGAPGAGLWLSRDGGASFAPMNGLPFSNVQRIAFDPANDAVVYATTFGGSVWRGPADD